MMRYAIGIDLGGTRIKGVAVNEEGNLLHHVYTPTNDGDDNAWKDAVRETVNELAKKLDRLDVIGISAPGLPNKENTIIAFMPGRLVGLENFNWNDFLNHPAYVLNDAVAALVA